MASSNEIQGAIRIHILAASKMHDDVAKEVLRVALGEIQLAEKATTTEEDRINAVKKVLKGINATLENCAERPDLEVNLKHEKETLENLLKDFVPETITKEEILSIISSKGIKIDAGVSEGKAMGMVMKELKTTGKVVEAAMVKEIIGEMRK